MNSKLLLLLAMLMVGCAWGQDLDVHVRNPVDVIGHDCPAGQHWEKGNEMWEQANGSLASWEKVCAADPKDAFCKIYYAPTFSGHAEDYDYWHCVGKKKKAEPEDVLAIQEKPGTYVLMGCAKDELTECGMRIQHWTCADKKRVLLESVDGSLHVCHKVSEGK